MVLYFSSTGNSKKVAELISTQANDDIVDVGRRIRENDYSDIVSDKPFVVVGPVYAGRLPRMMTEYLEKVKFVGPRRGYVIVTCSKSPHKAQNHAANLMAHKKLFFKGFDYIVMPEEGVELHDALSLLKAVAAVEESQLKLKRITNLIAQQTTFPKLNYSGAFMSDVINPIMYNLVTKTRLFAANNKSKKQDGFELLRKAVVYEENLASQQPGQVVNVCPNEAVADVRRLSKIERFYCA